MLFASTLYLPNEGLSYFCKVFSSIISQLKINISLRDSIVLFYFKKKEMKKEFQVVMDLVSKELMVKAGLFDAWTREIVLVMISFTSGTKINWSTFLYNVLVDMIVKHSTSFVIQISKMFSILGVLVSTAQDWNKTKMLDTKNALPLRSNISVLLAAAIKRSLVRLKLLQPRQNRRENLLYRVILNIPLLKGLLLNPFLSLLRKSQDLSRLKDKRRLLRLFY